MKLIIASDIHGNYKYTLKLDELINCEKPDRIVLLGDIYYSDSKSILDVYNPVGVSEILNKYCDNIICVKGNCDAYFKDKISKFVINKDYEIINVDNHKFLLTHGHLLDNISKDLVYDFIISGHTHIYKLTTNSINPGSVGLPKINSEHTCIIYENNIFKLIDLDNFKVINSMSIKN